MSGRLVGLAARRRGYSSQAGDNAEYWQGFELPHGFDKLSPQTTKVPSPKGFPGVHSHRGGLHRVPLPRSAGPIDPPSKANASDDVEV